MPPVINESDLVTKIVFYIDSSHPQEPPAELHDSYYLFLGCSVAVVNFD